MDITCGIDQILIAVWGCIFGDGNLIHVMEANLDALQKTMKQLEEKRDDLLVTVAKEEDKGLERVAQVRGWLSRVQDIGPQVTDLLEDRSTEISRLCFFEYFSWNCISSWDYGKKVLKTFNGVTILLSEGVFEVLAVKPSVRKVEEKYIQTTIGLDAKVREAWNCLMRDETRTLGLYGMGGVGKTTLLACINNKFFEVEKGFDVVVWVVVSKDLQITAIQDRILGRLRLDKEWEQESEINKASSIYNLLSRKRFVLLLDDLWSEVDLNRIGVPPPTQENRSKIVFTTRSKEVCRDMKADKEMKVDCLSPDIAWELFQITVGKVPFKCHKDIPRLARIVAQKCCGLPLALCVIGKAMACKEDVKEWHHAIKLLNSSSNEFPGMEENILPILKFSYDILKDEKAKACFVYCSLFPEDYEIEKETLIEYWICEGFINGDGDINEGHAIIGLLVRAHLLMEGAFTARVKMHDVVREMALWIASDFGKNKETICVKAGAKLLQISADIKWESLQRISLMSNQIAEITCAPNSPNLSTLFLQINKLENISGEFFRFMQALVVLDISENEGIVRLPEEISNLGSLQYLNLASTNIKVLPVGLKELRKLIHLNLEYTHYLESIVGISQIPNLQVLKFFYSSVNIDEILMGELQLFKHLKILTVTIQDAKVLERIQGIYRLARTIRALCLYNISASVVTFDTGALCYLQRLLIMGSKISEIKTDWESKAKSQLPCSSSRGFTQLSTVEIFNMQGPRDLTWLLCAQNLKFLVVVLSSSVEEIINREKEASIGAVYPDIGAPFERLEFLKLSDLYELKSICWNPLTFPNLTKSVCLSCPKLVEATAELSRPAEE